MFLTYLAYHKKRVSSHLLIHSLTEGFDFDLVLILKNTLDNVQMYSICITFNTKHLVNFSSVSGQVWWACRVSSSTTTWLLHQYREQWHPLLFTSGWYTWMTTVTLLSLLEQFVCLTVTAAQWRLVKGEVLFVSRLSWPVKGFKCNRR